MMRDRGSSNRQSRDTPLGIYPGIGPSEHPLPRRNVLRVDWARAQSETLAYIERARTAGDAEALDRGLKWFLCLHDVLLRGPRRGTRGRRGERSRMTTYLAQRFEAWRRGDRAALIEWWRRDRERALTTHERRRIAREQAHLGVAGFFVGLPICFPK